MASLRQIRANRENSKRSTGPSEVGKLSSRLNALTHGMTAFEAVFEDDIERIQDLTAQWHSDLEPEGPFQLHQVKRIVAASVLIERCQEQEADWRYRQACRTEAGRELDLSVEIENLANSLPRKPAQVARRMQQSVHGNVWLLARLRVLMELICGPNGTGPLRPLDEDRRGHALDVLGVAPELRLVRTVLDVPAAAETAGDTELAAHQARVIHERIVQLERFRTEDLAEVDAIDRDASALGRETKPDPTVRLIRRYKAAAQREMDKATAELNRLKERAAELAQLRNVPPEPDLHERPQYTRPVARPEEAAIVAAAVTPDFVEAAAPTAAPDRESTPDLRKFPVVDVSDVAETLSPDSEFDAIVRRAFASDVLPRHHDRRRQERAKRSAHKGFSS